MSQQQLAQIGPGVSADEEPASPFITDCHRVALEHLGRVFTDARPLATLIGEGKSGSSYIISSFLAGIEGDVAVARITEPCSDANAVMRKIIQAIGFELKDMNAADLENIFAMFLSNQRTHRRRTIICIEEAQASGWWALDKVCRLVELETTGKFGLTVILTGQPSLNALLNAPPLNAIPSNARARISLAPFTLAETTEYIRRRVESAGTTDIGQVFEYHAITLVHELSAGIPDTVSTLCSKCLELVDQEDTATVTTELVNKADKLLRHGSMTQHSDAEAGSVEVELMLNPDDNDSAPPRIILTHNGKTLREMTLDRSRLMIGRSVDSDLRINSNFTSRHHAVFIRHGGATIVMDLNSANGTYVNSRRISNQVVIDQDIISISDHDIKFIDPNARVRTTLESTGFNDTVIVKSL